jgi:cytochrome P450
MKLPVLPALPRVSLQSFPGEGAVDYVTARVGRKARVLASPPVGSDLRPIFGERGLPLIGVTLNVLRHGEDEGRAMSAKYGDVYWSRAFGTTVVWAVGPDAVQEVLTNKGKVYSQSGWVYFIGPFFTRGLMLLDGQEHLLQRRVMQEAFTRPRLESYLSQMQSVVDATLPTWAVDEPILMFPAIKKTSLDIATAVFMGASPSDESQHLIDAFLDTVRAGTGLIRFEVPGLPGLAWNRGLRGRKILEDYFRALIPAKRSSEDQDLFAVLCRVESDEGVRFTDEDVVNHMIFLMMAAHDTSTITATSMVYYMAKHPEWQERARAESIALSGTPLDLGAIEKLETLDLIFKEAMRLVAPVPAMVRRTTEDTDRVGHYVPAGTIVSVFPVATHLLDELWTKPDDFDPTRFAEPRLEQKAHRFGSVPFGGGAHKCIGMVFGGAEVKLLVHEMLLRYTFEVPTDYELEWDQTSLAMPTDVGHER